MSRKPVAFPIEQQKPKASATNKATKPGPRKTARRPVRKPTALPVDDIVIEPEDFEQPVSNAPLATGPEPETIAKTFRWGAIFLSAFTGLVSLWASVTFVRLIEDLFARSQILGWIGTGLLALAGFAALAIFLREIFGIFSLRKISRIQESAELARTNNDQKLARLVTKKLRTLYSDRADLSWGLAAIREHDEDIIDGRDRITLAEQHLLIPLDEKAGEIIASTSRKVTLLTAVTPAAILDILFVAAQNMKMLRQLATLYGGRPGTLGTFKLSGMVISHLAVAGGLALTDNLVQHFIGKGLLGRLSARFGEGAVNGILTTRIGLAALDLTRPIAFTAKEKPGLADFLKNIISLGTGNDENVKRV